MRTEDSGRARSIFLDALRLEPARRDAFLSEACGGDERLRSEVEALLISAESADNMPTQAAPAALHQDTNFSPGEILAGRFRIVRHIASGGMGAVYEAEDLQLRQPVALKTILSDIARREDTIERFKREIYLARKVTHINVCRIFDFAAHNDPEHGDVVFLTMELLSGNTLSRHIRLAGPLSPNEALPLIAQLTAGLTAAHDAGVIHRDFKSANVMLVPSKEGTRAVITDFGLAHANRADEHSAFLSHSGRVAGTPHYMAPEQVKAGPITPATDMYALGVVMYEMVTGKLPFTGDDPWEVAYRRLTEKPASPRVHVPLIDKKWEQAILRCLEREPEDRFACALDVANFLKGDAVAPARRTKRRRLLLASCLTALAVLGALTYKFLPRQAESRRAVAVLGFQNVSSIPEVAWVSTALSEGLRSELAGSGKLRTVSGEEVADFKKDLKITDFGSLSKQTLGHLHRLGADLVVVGSYTDLGKDAAGKIHLNMAIQDARRGEIIDALSADGDEKDLPSLISQTGKRLRAKLGLGELSSEKEAQLAIAQPNPEAAPLYSDGLNRLRAYDLSNARARFEQAVTADPNYPFAHAALAETWSMLGYDTRAQSEAKKALDLSGKLPLEDRLLIEGRYREMASDWNGAIESYGELFRHFPDRVDYGLRLAHAQMSSGKAAMALATLAELRKLPAPDGDDPRIALEQAETAASVGNYKTAETAATSAINSARTRGAKLLELRALNWACPVFRHLGQPEKARSLCQQALEIGSAVGDKLGMARAVNGLANIDNDEGDRQKALSRFEDALRISSEIGAKRDISGALNNVAMMLASMGKLAEARQKYEQALAIQREIGFTSELPNTLTNLGNVLREQGNLREARTIYTQAIDFARQNQSKNTLALALSSLAVISFEEGDLPQADRQLSEALTLQRSIGVQQDAAATLDSIGDLEFAKANFHGAEQHYREALAIQTQVGDRGGAATSQAGVARILIEQNDCSGATPMLNSALAEFQQENDSDSEALAHALLARCFLDQKQVPAAQKEIDAAEKLTERGGAKSVRCSVEIVAARALAAMGPAAQSAAIQSLERTQADAQKAGMLNCELEVRLAVGEINLGSGKAALARKTLQAVHQEAAAKGLLLLAQRAVAK